MDNLSDFYDRFILVIENVRYKFIGTETKVSDFVSGVLMNNVLSIDLQIPMPGGKGLEHINGFSIQVFPGEEKHRFQPHVHVYHGEFNLRVSLVTFECRGNMKGKLRKVATDLVKKNKEKYLEVWNYMINNLKFGIMPESDEN